MSNIGIPTWVFQLQPRNSEAREPTTNGIFPYALPPCNKGLAVFLVVVLFILYV